MSVAACSCGQKFRVRPEMAGKRAKCSKCGEIIVMPAAPPAAASPAAAASQPTADVAECSCGVKFRVRPEMAGKQARCPKCKSVIQLPGQAVAATAAATTTNTAATDDFGFGVSRGDDDFWNELGPTKSDAESRANVPAKKAKGPGEEFGAHEALAFTVKQASSGRNAQEIRRALVRRGVSRNEATRVVESVMGDPDDKKAASLDVGWLLFSTEGRIDRGQFWGGSLLVGAIDSALGGLLQGLVFAGVITQQVAGFLALPAIVLLVVMKVNVSVKRLHDNGYSGWVFLLVFIPIIGALFLFYLLGLKAGHHETNEFGHPPR